MHEIHDTAPGAPRLFVSIDGGGTAPRFELRSRFADERSSFLADVLEGLKGPHKRLSCKYFYDDAGSELFNRICETPEYYPTRAELEILRTYGDEIAFLAGEGIDIVELGSCNSRKVRVLLDHLRRPRCYVPVDVAAEPLQASAQALRHDYPGMKVLPLAEDFTEMESLPDEVRRARRTLFFFAGSTIGNFHPVDAAALLRRLSRLACRGFFLVGVDTRKPESILNAAYNDAEGVTAAFNKNLLVRINRELGGDFDLDQFKHVAFFNAEDGRVEMHLESLRDQTVHLGGETIVFHRGERIHTENSYKYSIPEFQKVARSSGLLPVRSWQDHAKHFSLHLLVRAARAQDALPC